MKKISLFFVALVAMFATGCQSQSLESAEGLQDVTVTVGLDGAGATRTLDTYGLGKSVTRCILEVYNEAGEKYARLIEPYDVVNNSVKFSLRLVAAQDYDIVAWADCGDDVSGLDDKYYNTSAGLGAISFEDSFFVGNTDKRDAFFQKIDANITSTTDLSMTLTRPFGQLSVFTGLKDINLASMTPASVKVTYTNTIPQNFNALTGVTDTGNRVSVQWSSKVADATVDSDGFLHLTTDYIFAPEQDMLLNFTIRMYNSNGDFITKNSKFNQIPVHRNYRTIVKGELMTAEGNLSITIDPGFLTDDKEVDENGNPIVPQP